MEPEPRETVPFAYAEPEPEFMTLKRQDCVPSFVAVEKLWKTLFGSEIVAGTGTETFPASEPEPLEIITVRQTDRRRIQRTTK